MALGPFLFVPFNYLKQYKYAFSSGCAHMSISLSSLVLITSPTLPSKFKLKLYVRSYLQM